MFDNYVWTDGQVQTPVTVKGKTGFVLMTLITYYRGIPLSMIEGFQVVVAGQEITPETLLFCPNDEIGRAHV